jgi:hypothetical protein
MLLASSLYTAFGAQLRLERLHCKKGVGAVALEVEVTASALWFLWWSW